VRPIPVVGSFRGLNENRVIGKVHARTPDHADKSRRGNHKKCACGGDAPAPPAPKRALVVVRTISFKLLYGLVILRHARRRLVRISVTTNPTAEWIVGQVTDAFPWDEGPRHLIRDRDGPSAQPTPSAFGQWGSAIIRLRRAHRGRAATSSASSARFGANLSITWWCSTKRSCVAF